MGIKDAKLAEELMIRVFNNAQPTEELRMEDTEGIKKLVFNTFGDGSVEPSTHEIHMFNNVITRTAATLSEPDIQQFLKYFANVQNVAPTTQLVEFKKSVARHIKFKWCAIGSAVSMKKVEAGERQYIELGHVQTGIVYDYLTLMQDPVEGTRELIRDIANARIQLTYNTIIGLIEEGAKSGGIIPASQCVNKANIVIGELDKAANTLGRRTGARPILLADRALINSFANKKVTSVAGNMPDAFKSQFYNYELTNLGSCDGVVFANNFTSELGEETQFDIDTGYLLAPAQGNKPFEIALAGLTQKTEEDIENGRVKMIIRAKLGVNFLYAGNIGRIQDTSVTSL